jgi:hypothetical protein
MFSRKTVAVVFFALVVIVIGTYALMRFVAADKHGDAIVPNGSIAGFSNEGSADYASFEENVQNGEGIELNHTEVASFTVLQTDDVMQLTEDNLVTNSTHIKVTCLDFADSSMIDLYLFNSNDMNNSIGYATLSKDKTNVTFDNLSFTEAYKIGVKSNGKEGELKLSITD